MENQNNGQQGSKKGIIVVGYIIPLLGLIFYFANKNTTTKEKENYAQAGTIFTIEMIISVLSGFASSFVPFLSYIGILNTVLFIFAIIAAVKSDENNTYEIPLVYNLSKSFFKQN